MAELNEQFLQHEGATDVLTFDLRTGTPPHHEFAEIYICTDVACENAAAFGTSQSRELLLYAVHGLLHLAGYDDHAEDDILAMRSAESDILAALDEEADLDHLFEFVSQTTGPQ